jgi:phosphomannomutase / phosphoglucomutase
MINKEIFRKYDIRGVVDVDFTDENLDVLCKAFATYFILNNRTKVVLARDNRFSSEFIRDKIIDIFCKAGIDVVDVGLVVTPIFYFATKILEIDAGIMITASHNPSDYNGFKVLLGESTIYGDEIQKISLIVDSNKFSKLNCQGELILREVTEEYIEKLKSLIKLGNRKIKVVLDSGNGTASLIGPRIFKEFGIELIEIYCDSDPSFPNHFPDPTKVLNLQDLIKLVKENKYDIGIGFDGDGDRIGIVDELGNIIWGDMLMILYSREILKKYPGSEIIVEVKCSELLMDDLKSMGGKPTMYKTGHSLIKAKMRESGAIFAGEMSGHMFFKDEYYGYDDAIYAALRIIRILSNTDKSISELLSDLPKVFSTPEVHVIVTENTKNDLVEKAKKYLASKFEINPIDGVRAKILDGWGLIRASNTTPEIIVRCESRTIENLNLIKGEIEQALSPVKIYWD